MIVVAAAGNLSSAAGTVRGAVLFFLKGLFSAWLISSCVPAAPRLTALPTCAGAWAVCSYSPLWCTCVHTYRHTQVGQASVLGWYQGMLSLNRVFPCMWVFLTGVCQAELCQSCHRLCSPLFSGPHAFPFLCLLRIPIFLLAQRSRSLGPLFALQLETLLAVVQDT
jgi:hypothetical protein